MSGCCYVHQSSFIYKKKRKKKVKEREVKLYEKVSTTKDIEIPLEKFVVISSYLLFFYNTFFSLVHKKKHI